jgi:hypothetical protein
MLLPDPQRALAVLAEAEDARDTVRRAGRRLEAAAEELEAQGLSRAQVQALLEPKGGSAPVSGAGGPSPAATTP